MTNNILQSAAAAQETWTKLLEQALDEQHLAHQSSQGGHVVLVPEWAQHVLALVDMPERIPAVWREALDCASFVLQRAPDVLLVPADGVPRAELVPAAMRSLGEKLTKLSSLPALTAEETVKFREAAVREAIQKAIGFDAFDAQADFCNKVVAAAAGAIDSAEREKGFAQGFRAARDYYWKEDKAIRLEAVNRSAGALPPGWKLEASTTGYSLIEPTGQAHACDNNNFMAPSDFHRVIARLCHDIVRNVDVLDPVTGDVLPAKHSTVWAHLGRSDKWEPHTVSGYYVWPGLKGEPENYRVFVRLKDAAGNDNARMLQEIKRAMPSADDEAGEQGER